MISKFISIKNVGRFENYQAEGDVTFKRYTLVYAGNGRGKTTLCAILRSAQSGDSSHVIGRKTLSSSGSQSIQILTPQGSISFDGKAWSSTAGDIAIFDQNFISENVYSGDVVSLDNRRNLYRVVLGEAGVAIAKSLEALDGESRAVASTIRETEALVRGLARTSDLERFLALQPDPEIDAQITIKSTEEASLAKAEDVKKRALFTLLELPGLPDNFPSLLSQTLEGVAADAVEKVRSHIQAHRMGKEGEQWLAKGLSFDLSVSCPFCDQSLVPAGGHLDIFKVYFGQGYKELQSAIREGTASIETSFGERRATALGTAVRNNETDKVFWEPLANVSFTQVEWPKFFEAIRDVREHAVRLLNAKQQNPLSEVPLDEAYVETLSRYESLAPEILKYNESVTISNEAIVATKASTATGDLARTQTELAALRVQKLRFEPDVAKACASHFEAVGQKTKIAAAKEAAKKDLETHAADTFKKNQAAINRILELVQAGFTLAESEVEYPGGIPSSRYKIVINGELVTLGDNDTPLSQPSFRNTLSAGDKSILALALFIAQIQNDPKLSDRIVVFDDPFSSQDSFRKDHTVSLIRECGEKAKQVIVLSHDREFLRRVWERLSDKTDDRKGLEFKRVGPRNTTMCVLDLMGDTEVEFSKQKQDLVDYYTAGAGKERDVVQKIRPVLETHLRRIGPPLIASTDNLGAIATKAAEPGCTHSIAAIATEIDALNFYTKRYMHGDNPNWATEPIDSDELQGMVYRALQLVGGA